MGVMVGDLLVLARLDEVREPAPRASGLWGMWHAKRVTTRAPQAPDRVIRLATAGPLAVLGDREQLRQVLANLCETRSPTRRPGRRSRSLSKARTGSSTVKVRDHGPGLEPGAEERVFDRFWRPGWLAPKRRRRGRPGARNRRRDRRGARRRRPWRANAAGGGAEFIVTFPAAVGAAT